MFFSEVDGIRTGGVPLQGDSGISDEFQVSSKWGFDSPDSAGDTIKIGQKPAADKVSITPQSSNPDIALNLNKYKTAGTDTERYEAMTSLVNTVNNAYMKADSPDFKQLSAIKDPEIRDAMMNKLTKNLLKHDITFVEPGKSNGVDVAKEYIDKINILKAGGSTNETANTALSMISTLEQNGVKLQDAVKLTSNTLYAEKIVNNPDALETAKVRASSNLWEMAERY